MRKTSNGKTSAARASRLSSEKLKIRHILVPMDFSGPARQALTFAVRPGVPCLSRASCAIASTAPPALSIKLKTKKERKNNGNQL